MPHYKDAIGKLYWLEANDNPIKWLKSDCILISEDEALAISLALNPPPDPKIAIQAQISSMEAAQLLPRISREFMLLSFATQAAAAGVDPMLNAAYAKLKAFDDQITALRSQLA